MRWRACFSISGSAASELGAVGRGRRRSRLTAVESSVLRSCEVLGRAVSGQTEMHSMHWVQFSGM